MKITTVDDFVKHKVAPEHKAVVASLRKLMKKYGRDAKEGIGSLSYQVESDSGD